MTRGIDDGQLRYRLHRFLDQRLPDAVDVELVPARLDSWVCGEPVPVAQALGQPFHPIAHGARWGAPWSTMWLRVVGEAPAPPPGCRVELLVDLGFLPGMPGFQAEGMAYRSDGSVIKALNPSTRWVPVTAGQPYEVLVEAAANPTILLFDDQGETFIPTTMGDRATAGETPLYTLGRVGAVVRHIETERLIRELEVLSGLAWSLDEGSPRRSRLMASIDRALDAIDTTDIRGSASAARAELAPELASPASPSAHDVTAIGHAHIDTAWLWPFRETRRKVARTVANVLDQMDTDQDLVYAMSSAQQYLWLQEDHPALFDRLRERVKEGRFLPVGGMWVESDVLMPAGESLVRQLLQGTRFFESAFGIRSTQGWLPDSFGYSGALPQLLRSAGITRFVTQKMSWSTVNRFPHHTFWWEGIDGSRLLTHFPSVDTYNSTLSGPELAHAAGNLADPTILDASIMPFGYGDGGGGPTREMLERARLTADLEGSPRVTVASPDRYFDSLEAIVSSGRELPVWLGEMYLEGCRGTYTTQARTKERHRRVERLLHEAELWATQASVRARQEYPYELLENAWRELLLMEFHDVLPGSSIAWVYQDAVARLESVSKELEELIENRLDALSGDGTAEVVANPAPFEVDGVAPQAIGIRASEPAEPVLVTRDGRGIRLRNAAIDVLIDAVDGTVRSLVERVSGRELVAAGGRLNLPTLHRDAPARWDAWDIDESIDAVVETLDAADSVDVAQDENGSATVTVRRRFGASALVQRIEVNPGNDPRLLLGVTVDWQERERMLKLEFPLAIVTDRWQAETQFGVVERPTHRNTSWDEARFEGCALRWVRVAEPGCGVALVNERTYGHDARRQVDPDGRSWTRLRASLLRSSQYPDPDPDRGTHTFRFALLAAPDVSDAVRAAATFAGVSVARRGQPVAPLVLSSADAVVVDTVKLAEDRSGDVIVRLYESRGARTITRLEFGFGTASVRETDILEQPLGRTEADLDRLEFEPFRVRSFRVTPM